MNVNLTRTLHRIHLFFLMFPIVCSNTVCAQNGSYRGTSPLPPVGSLNSNSRILPKPDARRLDSPSMTNASGRDASTGMLPNVFYNSVSWEELRAHRRFTALPPAATVCIAGEPSYRFVRQDDDLWARLHPGRLTTGYAAAALGFFEPGAAAILKLSKGRCVAMCSTISKLLYVSPSTLYLILTHHFSNYAVSERATRSCLAHIFICYSPCTHLSATLTSPPRAP